VRLDAAEVTDDDVNRRKESIWSLSKEGRNYRYPKHGVGAGKQRATAIDAGIQTAHLT
jgi:hypothetical protein